MQPMPTSYYSHCPTACMTFINQTFAPTPKSQLETFGVDPTTVMHTPAIVRHGQDTTPEGSTDYCADRRFCM